MLFLEELETFFERIAREELFYRMHFPMKREEALRLHREIFSDVLAWACIEYPQTQSQLVRYERNFRRVYQEFLRRQENFYAAASNALEHEDGAFCVSCKYFLPNEVEKTALKTCFEDPVLMLEAILKPERFKSIALRSTLMTLHFDRDPDEDPLCMHPDHPYRSDILSWDAERGEMPICYDFKAVEDFAYTEALNQCDRKLNVINQFQEDIREDVYIIPEVLEKALEKVKKRECFCLRLMDA